MVGNYKKDCYDINEHLKIHYSHGVKGVSTNLNFLHYDTDLIIEYYRKGNASIHIEGNIYNIEEGDIVVLNPDELHVTIRDENCYLEKIVLHISDTLFERFGGETTAFFDIISKKTKGKGNLISSDIVKEKRIDKIVEECLIFSKEYSFDNEVLVTCKIIDILYRISKVINKAEGFEDEFVTSNEKVNKMIDYINRHYTEEVTLETLACKFHFSKYYIAHLFKDYVGVSPYDYLIIRRLYKCNNLIRANCSVKEACFMVGFNNYSNFYRLYKKRFNITPQQFKEQLNTNSIL